MKKHLLVIVLGMFSGIFGHEVPTGSESPGMAKFSQMLSKLVNPLVIKEQITDNEWMMTVKAKLQQEKKYGTYFQKKLMIKDLLPIALHIKAQELRGNN